MDTDALAAKYHGRTVSNYERERSRSPTWQSEHATVEQFLQQLPGQSRLLDVPVGTGRFAELYRDQQLEVVGVDVSADMLAAAATKGDALGLRWTLRQGSIFELDWPDHHFDVSLCIRLFQWLTPPEITRALTELKRVTRHQVVFGAPTYLRLNQIRSPATLSRCARQSKLRFYRWRKHSDQLCHRADVLLQAIHDAGLRLVERYPIHDAKQEYALYVTEPSAS